MSDATVQIELARHQWEEGRRTIDRVGSTDPVLARRLARQVELLSAELARRLGQVFTLAEMVGLYASADRWSLDLLGGTFADETPFHVSTVADAAFEHYARRATDYTP